jgi:hypothetical protein
MNNKDTEVISKLLKSSRDNLCKVLDMLDKAEGGADIRYSLDVALTYIIDAQDYLEPGSGS